MKNVLPIIMLLTCLAAGVAATNHNTDMVIMNIGLAIIMTILFVHQERK